MIKTVKYTFLTFSFVLSTYVLTMIACAQTNSALTLAQAAAATNRLFGSEVEAKLLRTDPIYASTVKREFNVIVPQNEMKFG